MFQSKTTLYRLSLSLSLSLSLFLNLSLFSQQITKATPGTFALTNAKIETITNGTIQTGNLIIKDGKIAAVGTRIPIPPDATQIDCNGLTIYPGMIDGGTTLGLNEIGAVSLTMDSDELGDLTPHVQSLTAVNPNSALIPVTRVSGVTTVLTKPTGGRFPGTAALIDLLGYTPEQMYAGFKAVLLNYPSSGSRGRFDRRTDEERAKQEEKHLKELNKVWEQAKLYAALSSEEAALKYNPELEALAPVTTGEATLMIEVHRAKDIKSAIKWVEDNKVKAIFTGVSEGWRVAEELAASKIPVITGPVLSRPTRSSDKYDRPYSNAGAMQKAGVKVAIRSNDSENVRNLPYNAGFAATYGMGKEEALKAITIVPAEIFGLADKIGSLEAGKTATLFVTDGDPFETKTQVKHLFINGWNVPLESRQTYLYDEFLQREPGVKE